MVVLHNRTAVYELTLEAFTDLTITNLRKLAKGVITDGRNEEALETVRAYLQEQAEDKKNRLEKAKQHYAATKTLTNPRPDLVAEIKRHERNYTDIVKRLQICEGAKTL